MKRHLLVLAALIFWLGGVTAQTNFIRQDSIFARTSDCALGVAACIDSIAYDNINDLRFFLNGQQYSTQFTPCFVNTVHNYSYSDIFRGGENGPWRLDSWTVNGQTFSGTFNNLQTLLDSMRRWNPSGNWQLENSARIIYGYVAASTTYSCQQIFGTSRGGQSQVCYNSGVEYRGLRFNVPAGVHQLIVEKVRTGERDTVALLAACLKTETVRRTVSLGSNATYCASLTDLLGTLTTTRNVCPRPASAITFGAPATTCVRYAGTAVGTDTACIQVCDRYGFCDTTYLIVTAATSSTNLTLSDTISVGLRRTTCELALPTGTITAFTNTCPSNSGTNASFDLDAGTNCVTYRGLTVGTDTACLRVCNTDGLCTTTTLTITTIPYVNPTTQTRFTYTDTITVGLTRPKCSFNAPTGAITVFENVCANNSGTNVAFTLDQATKCVTYRGVAIGVDTACIRVCNAAGQCDTTYMFVGAIINGNGGGTNNGTGRTIIVRDTISVGSSRENCGVSVPATILSITNNCPQSSGTNVAFSIDAVRRCVTYRGLTIGADTACYVICNANGVCDTTQYIVNAVDTANRGKTIVIRDTISVGLARNDCRVSIPRGTFAAITNNCPSSSGTNVSFTFNSTTRCVDYTGLLVGADTACIIVCTTAGICDTTIYIITAIENASGGNSCGLRVSPTVQIRSCGITGFINLAVSGSTAPYTFRWADLTGNNQPQNRTGLEAGTYTVTVSSANNCDTTLSIVVANNAINCGGGGTNRCGLIVAPTATPKTCTTNGVITLAVSGSTAPYTFDWTDLTGTTDPQNRTNLQAGTYTVKVTPSVLNCDTTIAVVVANNATNCGSSSGSNIRFATVNVVEQDSTTFCVDSSRVLGGFTVILSSPQVFSTIAPTPPTGCFKIKGFVAGRDTAIIILVGSNGVRDTTQLVINVTPRNNSSSCGLIVAASATPKTCATNGTITLVVSGSTAPYTFDWTDLTGTADPQNRTDLQAGTYTVKVKAAALNCDTTLSVSVINNCAANRCGLVVVPTATPKTCVGNGAITLAVTGSTAPYTFDWTDLTGTNDPQNRTNLDMGIYTVKVTPSVPNCDTTLTINVANNAVNCGNNGSNIRNATVNVTVQDSTTFCVDSSRVSGGFTIFISASQTFSTIAPTPPTGCFKIKGFVVGQDSAIIILTGTNGVRDTTKLIINVVPRNSGNCGLVVAPTTTPRTCVANGSITLAVSGSTAPYTFDWTDLAGTTDPQNRANLAAGNYTVKVASSAINCDTTLTIRVADDCAANRCGLIVLSTVVPKTCTANGSISLGVTGSTAPYTYAWSDSTTVSNPQSRSNLAAGTYTVKVTPSVPNCDTTISITVRNNAVNCGGNVCGLVIAPTAIPKTCSARGSISLAVSGGTAPYSYRWSDSTTVLTQNRTNLDAGIYSVTVTSASPNCDTTLRITVANDSTNCASSRSRVDSIRVFTQDSTTYCVDSSRVTGGFTIFISGSQVFSTIAPTPPRGCFKIKGFVAGRDSALIVLTGANGFKDTLKLIITVVPKPVLTQRSDTITIKILETRTYCPDTSRLRGSPITLIKFCSTDPFNNTRIRLDTVSKCVAVTGISTGQDTFCIAVCNAAGFCDTTKLFVNVTRDTVTPQYRTDTVRLFVGDSLTYCNIDTGMIRGAVDSIYNHCFNSASPTASISITPAKCLKIKGLAIGKDSACIVVLNRLFNLRDTTKVIIIVSKRDTSTNPRRTDSITVQVGDTRTYCVDTSRLRGARVTSIATCLPVFVDNSIIFIVNSTKCVDIDGLSVGRDTVCLQVCNANNLCDTTLLYINVVPRRPLASSTVLVPVQVNKDSTFCGVDTSQIRGRVDTIYDACPGKNGSKARMVIDNVTKCVKITGVNVGNDTMCVVVCNTASRICDTTFVVAVVTDTAGGRIIVIANDDFDSLRRGTNKTLELYNNDTIRPRRATSLTIVQQPIKGTVDTISFANGLVKYTAGRSPSSCGLDSFRYRVCIDNVCDTALVVILVVCPDTLQVWRAISPNGDGKNDVLLVEGLQNYPNHTVCVFNRWGNAVLNQKNYQNDWQGTWNGTNVPDGTYYYFIRNDDTGEMLLTGYVQILR